MTSLQVTRRVQKKKNNHHGNEESALPTFLDHVHELQGRLFAIVLAFLVVAGAAYPFFDKIVAVIVAPLDKGQELVYLTPGGAFSFIIKVCLYIGIMGALPVIIYQLYQFLMPAVRRVHLRVVLGYTLASLVLAIIGVVFAYVVSLPAALHFLTSFDLYHINPMLTIDSYFSFVMTYLLAGALLFQLPIVMLIINSVTPLTPSKLMGAQRGIIVGSFVVAAIISPTPDALNQVLLASPMIVMYQLGIIIIWFRNRRVHLPAAIRPQTATVIETAPATVVHTAAVPAAIPMKKQTMKIDGVVRSPRSSSVVPPRVVRTLAVPTRDMHTSSHHSTQLNRHRQTIDGFFPQTQT